MEKFLPTQNVAYITLTMGSPAKLENWISDVAVVCRDQLKIEAVESVGERRTRSDLL